MGIVFRHDFFEIFVFSKDHNPPHFHIYFPNKKNWKGVMKIEIDSFEVIDLKGISVKDFKKMERFLTEERLELIKKEWESFHGQEKN